MGALTITLKRGDTVEMISPQGTISILAKKKSGKGCVALSITAPREVLIKRRTARVGRHVVQLPAATLPNIAGSVS